MCLKRDIKVTATKVIIVRTDMTSDSIPLAGNPPETRTINQTKSLMTARPPLATVAEDHITPPTRNVPNMGNQNRWRKCMRSVMETDPWPSNEHELASSSNNKGPGNRSGSESTMRERLMAAYSDSEDGSTSEYSSAVSDLDPVGSQYSSDGELYNYESEYGSSSSECSASEHFGAI
jgi:hypothetical protein